MRLASLVAGCLLLGAAAGGRVLLGAAAGAEQDEPPPPPEVGVSVRQLADAEIVEAVLPGLILDGPVSTAGDHLSLVVLLVPEDDPTGPRSLHGVTVDDDGVASIEQLASGLGAEIDTIAAIDVAGDGSRRVILGEPGILYSLDRQAEGSRPRKILEAAGFDLSVLARRGLLRPDRPLLPQPRLGRLDVFHLGVGGATAAAGADLPMRARRVPGGLRLWTPPVHLLASDGAATLVAVGPEAQGKRRLLTTLIDLDAAEPETAPVEVWCQLSANERIAQSWYLSIDGRPALAVAALDADKLGLLEKKKLRVFPLRADRTRAGSPPALEIQTATRHWYPLGVHVSDLDLDGREDLVVVQPDGLGAKKLVIEAYRGKGNGGFFRTPRRSVLTAPEARWTFGHDFDGDGVGELVTLDDDARLRVFRGLPESKKLVVEKQARWSFEVRNLADSSGIALTIHLGEGEIDSDTEYDHSGPRVADFDGDGRAEILLRAEAGGRSILRLIEPR
ncbi:MAG: VCBS repeat-containing protein [bacterium]|nr:VCBS repeat-containing protein [bacterium]